VSLLLSHFENLASPRQSFDHSTPRQTPQRNSHLQPPQNLDEQHRARTAHSLDIPQRENAHNVQRRSQYHSSHINRGHAEFPISRASTAGTMSRQRPVSVGPYTSTYALPAVTVDSPLLLSSEDQSNSLRSSAINATDKQSTTAGLRNWSPPTQPTCDSRDSSPSRTRPGSASVDSRAQLRASSALSSSGRDGNSYNGPMPPPVKRAEKPRIPSQPFGTAIRSRTPLLAPPIIIPPSQERVSPFSTPPSSEGSPTADVSSPLLGSFQESNFPIPPVHHSIIEKRREQSGIPPYSVQGHDARQSGFQSRPELVGSSELRPGLPPRPGISQLTKKDFHSFTSASAPGTVAAEPTSRSHTPPKRTTPSGNKQVFETQSHRPTEPTPPHQSAAPVQTHMAQRQVNPPCDDGSEPPRPAIEATANVLTDFPDFSETNRRRPWVKEGPSEIHTKYDTRLFDICGQYVCTTGYLTKIWDLQNGQQVMSMSHGDTVKVTALAFKPGGNAENEGKRLWLGNNSGDIQEIDIQSQTIVLTKTSTNPRREVTKIYRHQNEMWTLDDDGKLDIWLPDEYGLPDLQNSHVLSFRVPKAHSFAMIIADQLWFATGKEIRIFQPGVRSDKPFQILQRPLMQPGVGDVTSGALISSHLDRAYFGHADGKVTIYSTHDYACLGIVNVSVYKINCLAGAGNYLWAGYNTGMIYVYDTESRPWKVKKDWHAHEDPVACVLVDRSSIWKNGRLQVASLGNDNALRIWDGMLEDDWLGTLTMRIATTLTDIHCRGSVPGARCRILHVS